MKLKQGQIVLVPFPFSDLRSVKTRPALVVSKTSLKGDDVILCAITSKKGGLYEVGLSNKSLIKGQLPVNSYVRVNKIVSLHKTIIRRVVAEISDRKKVAIFRKMKEILAV